MAKYQPHHALGTWAIERRAAQLINARLAAMDSDEQYARPDDGDGDKDEARIDVDRVGGVAIVSVTGVLTKYPIIDEWWYVMGGTSTLELENVLKALAVDPGVTGVVLVIDSPGGEIAGVSECGQTIRDFPKPIIGFIADCGCSGAYWLGSQCKSLYCNDTASVGSIGAFMLLYDTSEMYSKMGVKPVLIAAGELKGAGFDGIPITDAHKAEFERQMEMKKNVFLQAVSSGRKMAMATLKALATGTVFIGQEAKDKGLVDGVQSFDATVQAFAASVAPPAAAVPAPLPGAAPAAGGSDGVVAATTSGGMSTTATIATDKTPGTAPTTETKPAPGAPAPGTPAAGSVASGADGSAAPAPAPVVPAGSVEADADRLARLDALCKRFPGEDAFVMEMYKAGHDIGKAVGISEERARGAAAAVAAAAKPTAPGIATPPPAAAPVAQGAAPVGVIAESTDGATGSAASDPMAAAEARWESDESLRTRYFSKSSYLAAVKYEQKFGPAKGK